MIDLGTSLLSQVVAFLDTPLARSIEPAIIAGALLYAILPWVDPTFKPARVLLTVLSGGLMLTYVVWRFLYTLPPRQEILSWVAGVSFFTIEAIALSAAALSLFLLSRVSNRTPEVEAHRGWVAAQGKPPLVDVFICTYNEDEAMLERTIIGATGMNYPRFRTWLLDDGRRPAIRELCEKLGCGYIARSDNAHAKAGNINHGLGIVAALPEPPDFISIFDADFVPMSNFLSRTMCLFHDDKVGVVQTPQHFVNADPIQTNLSTANVWPDEQRYFFDILMPSMDAWGCAFCCGTSSVIRFEAIQAIGGFPTDSVTEDYLVTLRLKEIGFNTVYLNEPLSFGLAPEGLKEYITQRVRWCLGLMQIVRGRSGPFSRHARSGLIYRVGLLHAFLSWSFVYLYKVAGVLVPILYLMFGIKAVDVSLLALLAVFLPYFVIYSMTMSWISRGRVLFVLTDVTQFLTAPTALKAVVSGLLRPRGRKFTVTAKGGDRGARFVEWPLFRLFLFLLIATIASVVVAFPPGGEPVQTSAALALAWSWFNILALALLCLICFEQPRRRAADRFPAEGQATLTVNGIKHRYRLNDISVGGAQFVGQPPGPIGAKVLIGFGHIYLSATVTRAFEGKFGVRFDNTLSTRVTAVRHVYSGIYLKEIERVAPISVVNAIFARAMR